ncbi:MAG: hypothetical protein [Circular genetic element sp.]|nr:MAG: hypothetical protein [Circular genetic element sp.]
MTKAMTGSFYLTESVTLPAANASGAFIQGQIDISAYVNVPTGQALAIESVDLVYQRATLFTSDVEAMVVGNGSIDAQLCDLNPGTTFVRADDQSLVASGSLNIDQPNCIASVGSDFFPDNHGPSALSEAFLVVNDSLFLTAVSAGTAIGANDVFVTARIKCRVVKLSTTDWMAIAIQSTASDN